MVCSVTFGKGGFVPAEIADTFQRKARFFRTRTHYGAAGARRAVTVRCSMLNRCAGRLTRSAPMPVKRHTQGINAPAEIKRAACIALVVLPVSTDLLDT